ncbi:MAG: nuclear transport factor 2 family protein [Pseudomonadota bacterium]
MPITEAAFETIAKDYTAAWNSGSPEAVAFFYAENGGIVINRGDPWDGRAKVAEMAAGFYADVPDLKLTCDFARLAGDHAFFGWTFTGHDAGTNAPLRVSGWEEWDLDDTGKVKASKGWFDADDYARQVEGG